MSEDADRQRAATMRDVAALADVSLKTVSRVVNHESGVSPELVDRVADAVALLGYRRDLAASSLRRTDRRTATIGLLLENVANPFDAALHRTIEQVAHRHANLVLAGSGEDDPRREREVLRAFASRKVDGLVAMPAGRDHSALLQEHRLGTPVVFVDRPDHSGLADSVTSDNAAGAAAAVDHLVQSGHRRIGFVGDRQHLWTASERLAGYRSALRAHRLTDDPELVHADIDDVEHAHTAVLALLDLANPPTALFAARNLLTVGAVQALRQRGLQRRVALVGFDDFLLADLLDPGVTVLAQDVAETGRRAAELLFERMAGATGPAQHVVLPPTLVARGSGELPATPP